MGCLAIITTEYAVSGEVDCVYGGYPEPAGESGIMSECECPFLERSVVSFSDSVVFGGVWGSGFMNNAGLSAYILEFFLHVFPTVVTSDSFDIDTLLLQ